MPKNLQYLLALLAITILAVFIRLNNVSTYKFYPDSYTSLLVADNISTEGSAVGLLGPAGSDYPQFLEWTRPVFPILLAYSQIPEKYLALVLGILAIPLAGFLLYKITDSKGTGLIAAALLALSFNHTVWGGFILTETAGVFFLLLYLVLLFSFYDEEYDYASPKNLLLGAALAVATLTRYEYFLMILPTLYLARHNPAPYKFLLNLIIGFIFTIGAVALWLAPWPFGFDYVWNMIKNSSLIFGLVGLCAIGILAVYNKKITLSEKISPTLSYIVMGIFSVLTLIIILQIIFKNFSFLNFEFSGFRDFVSTDYLIAILSISGLISMLLKKRYILATFVLLSMSVIAPFYYRTNPEMQRYWTHLIPFLLIPASIFVRDLFVAKKWKLYALIPLLAIALLQLYSSYGGIKNWNENLWFQPGYEEISAKKIEQTVPKNSLLIVSTPEPYYYFTNYTTHSIADAKPFVYIDDSLDSREAYIVVDEGMRDWFPKFTTFTTKSLGKYSIDEYTVGVPYRRQFSLYPETDPVMVYKIKLGELKGLIQQ